MKAISTGNTYKIYDDSLRVYDLLPAQCYSVRFNKMTGFFLEKHSDIEIKEDKIYGVHETKVDKVLKSFDLFNRSLGVILSGDKGIGKSLFAKILSVKAIEAGFPLLIVDTYYPGIAAYIESIEQKVVVLFDEFDKTFVAKENNVDSQAEMLSLFDGVAQGKKLFIITCNELRKLNDYLVNRPGRFHYHFRFEYPSPMEIKEYLEDKLINQYYTEIEKVISFSKKVKLNYDCLRAIAFEINLTGSFEESIKDLNILNIDTEEYMVILHFENGLELKQDTHIDIFSDEENELNFYSYYEYIASITYTPSDCRYDTFSGLNLIDGTKVTVEYAKAQEDDTQEVKDLINNVSNTKLQYVAFKRKGGKRLHYSV